MRLPVTPVAVLRSLLFRFAVGFLSVSPDPRGRACRAQPDTRAVRLGWLGAPTADFGRNRATPSPPANAALEPHRHRAGWAQVPGRGHSPQPRTCRLPVMVRHVEPGRAHPAGASRATASPPPARPSREELQAAYGRTVPDLIAPGLRVVLVGINPSLWSGAVGHHFASPSNRLWPALAGAGLTPRRLHPSETSSILACGLGVTNLVARATARADELSRAEILGGAARVLALAERWEPAYLAFLGLTSYR